MKTNGQQQSPVVVITGGSAGVGRATARSFAARGARIGILARGKEGLEATRKEVEALGGEALAIPTDVADPEQVDRAATEVEDKFGPIDIWINNAMVAVFSEFKDVEPEEYRRVTDVCYHGTVFGTMSALNRMLPRDSGTIVHVGSALAYRGIPLQSAYCGAQHGIQGMFESVRTELIHNESKVQMVIVHLPAINTPQFEWSRVKVGKKPQPVPPIFEPEVAADAIVYAATEGRHRREIHVGKPTVQTIAGNKVAPALGDWYLARTGFEDQMLDETIDGQRDGNLFEPVEGDFGAHGPFSDESTGRSLLMEANKHKPWVMGAFGFAGALALGLAMR